MKDTEKTVVIFRKWKRKFSIGVRSNDILALFPYEDGGDGLCGSYERVGQHGGANYIHCIACTVPATPGEYKLLKAELEDLGYNLEIKRRCSHRSR